MWGQYDKTQSTHCSVGGFGASMIPFPWFAGPSPHHFHHSDPLWALAGGGWHRRLCHVQPFSRWWHPCTARWHRGEHSAAHLATAGLWWGWTFTVAKEYLIRSSHVDSVYSPARKKGMKKPVDKGLPKSNIYIRMYNMKFQEKWSWSRRPSRSRAEVS